MSELEESLATQLKWAKLPTPTRQFMANSGRRWRWDFAWLKPHDLLVEVDGGTWSGGRHTRGKGYEGDCEKQNAAAIAGFRTMRVTGKQVEDGRAVQWIKEALNQ